MVKSVKRSSNFYLKYWESSVKKNQYYILILCCCRNPLVVHRHKLNIGPWWHWYVSVHTLNDCITLPKSSSWGNAAQFLPKSMLHSHSKSTHFKCALNTHRDVWFFGFFFKPWKFHKGGNTFLIRMKYVLRGTHWTVCANFLHPLLKCLYCLKPSLYSIHLETSVIWLQVIHTILASACGVEEESEYSNKCWRNYTDLKSSMEITSFMCWRTNWYNLAEGIFWSPLCTPSSCA